MREHFLAKVRRGEVTHGLPRTYNYGCRCDLCKEANSTYRARLKKERIARMHEEVSSEQ